jgi:hypothetical protein
MGCFRRCQEGKMHDDARRGNYTEAEVEARLADAGRVLLALPWAGCFPCGFRSLWPSTEPMRFGQHWTPTSAQISAMDLAYGWTALINDQDERRLVLMRSLMLPPSASGRPRHVWTWGRLRRATGLHPDTLKKRWANGIAHVVAALNTPKAQTARSITRPLPTIDVRWPGVPYGFGPLARRESR